MRLVLAERYDEPFDSIGFNLYRDGHDSVAWHGDRHANVVTNPVVAIVSLGAPRPFRMRPKGGGRSLSWDLGNGDLFVMGGACQHDWEHTRAQGAGHTGPADVDQLPVVVTPRRVQILCTQLAEGGDRGAARAGHVEIGDELELGDPLLLVAELRVLDARDRGTSRGTLVRPRSRRRR